jgi:hypothetical protein
MAADAAGERTAPLTTDIALSAFGIFKQNVATPSSTVHSTAS